MDSAKESCFFYGSNQLASCDNMAKMTIAEKIGQRREEILEIARKRGALDIRVFGSVARGQSTSSSDIDFLVEMEPGRTLFDLGGLNADLEALLGVKVDVVTEKGLDRLIRDQVMTEAVSI